MAKPHPKGKAPSRHAIKRQKREARKQEEDPSHAERKAQKMAQASRNILLRQNRRWLRFKQAASDNQFLTKTAYQQLCQLWAKPRSQPTPGKKALKLDENAKRGAEMLEQEREAACVQQGNPENIIDWFAIPGSFSEQQNKIPIQTAEQGRDVEVLDEERKAFPEGLTPIQEPKLEEAALCNPWEYRSSTEGMVIAGDDEDSD